MLKNLPANVGNAGLIPALERSLGDMATYCSILAWEITWTEEPGRLQSMGLQKNQTRLMTTQQQIRVILIKMRKILSYAL